MNTGIDCKNSNAEPSILDNNYVQTCPTFKMNTENPGADFKIQKYGEKITDPNQSMRINFKNYMTQ